MTDSDVDRVQCPFCLEQIIRGAKVCKHCGKTQPLTSEAKRKRSSNRWIAAALVGAGVVVVFFVAAGWSYQNEQDRLRRAAVCNGTLTADQLEATAEQAAKAGNMSIYQAEDAAIVLACPAMAK